MLMPPLPSSCRALVPLVRVAREDFFFKSPACTASAGSVEEEEGLEVALEGRAGDDAAAPLLLPVFWSVTEDAEPRLEVDPKEPLRSRCCCCCCCCLDAFPPFLGDTTAHSLAAWALRSSASWSNDDDDADGVEVKLSLRLGDENGTAAADAAAAARRPPAGGPNNGDSGRLDSGDDGGDGVCDRLSSLDGPAFAESLVSRPLFAVTSLPSAACCGCCCCCCCCCLSCFLDGDFLLLLLPPLLLGAVKVAVLSLLLLLLLPPLPPLLLLLLLLLALLLVPQSLLLLLLLLLLASDAAMRLSRSSEVGASWCMLWSANACLSLARTARRFSSSASDVLAHHRGLKNRRDTTLSSPELLPLLLLLLAEADDGAEETTSSFKGFPSPTSRASRWSWGSDRQNVSSSSTSPRSCRAADDTPLRRGASLPPTPPTPPPLGAAKVVVVAAVVVAAAAAAVALAAAPDKGAPITRPDEAPAGGRCRRLSLPCDPGAKAPSPPAAAGPAVKAGLPTVLLPKLLRLPEEAPAAPAEVSPSGVRRTNRTPPATNAYAPPLLLLLLLLEVESGRRSKLVGEALEKVFPPLAVLGSGSKGAARRPLRWQVRQ